MDVSETERLKLTANLLNTVAAGIILAVLVAPVAGLVFGTVHPTSDGWVLTAFILFGLIVAGVLHLLGRRILEGGR